MFSCNMPEEDIVMKLSLHMDCGLKVYWEVDVKHQAFLTIPLDGQLYISAVLSLHIVSIEKEVE
jgi:hypothetical protein